MKPITMTAIDFARIPTPQLALMVAEDMCVGLKKRVKASKDELRELRNACLEHEGTDLAWITLRWENFKRIRPSDILRIGADFSIGKNGCGPAGWKAALIPDRPFTMLWLVSFHAACDLHDVLYTIGGDWVAKLFADLYFRRKMEDACRRKLRFTWMLGLRWGERTAELYYHAVSKYGDAFFKWDRKSAS